MALTGGDDLSEPLVCGDSLGDVADGVPTQAIGVGQDQSQWRAGHGWRLRQHNPGEVCRPDCVFEVNSSAQEFGLIGDEIVAIDVEERGFDVVV